MLWLFNLISASFGGWYAQRWRKLFCVFNIHNNALNRSLVLCFYCINSVCTCTCAFVMWWVIVYCLWARDHVLEGFLCLRWYMWNNEPASFKSWSFWLKFSCGIWLDVFKFNQTWVSDWDLFHDPFGLFPKNKKCQKINT